MFTTYLIIALTGLILFFLIFLSRVFCELIFISQENDQPFCLFFFVFPVLWIVCQDIFF
eukprot:UN04053